MLRQLVDDESGVRAHCDGCIHQTTDQLAIWKSRHLFPLFFSFWRHWLADIDAFVGRNFNRVTFWHVEFFQHFVNVSRCWEVEWLVCSVSLNDETDKVVSWSDSNFEFVLKFLDDGLAGFHVAKSKESVVDPECENHRRTSCHSSVYAWVGCALDET